MLDITEVYLAYLVCKTYKTSYRKFLIPLTALAYEYLLYEALLNTKNPVIFGKIDFEYGNEPCNKRDNSADLKYRQFSQKNSDNSAKDNSADLD